MLPKFLEKKRKLYMGTPKTEFPTQCWGGGGAIFYQLIS
jgi:hypothetical protein